MHLEKLKCRNKENEGTLTVPEWRWELAFEGSAGFLAISQEGICKVFLKICRNKDCSLSRNWVTWVGRCSFQLTLKNARMGSFLFYPPLFLRTTMVQWVWKATWPRCWGSGYSCDCTCASPRKSGVCDAPWSHGDHTMPQWLQEGILTMGGKQQPPKKPREYAHVQPACGFGRCPVGFLPKSSTQLHFSVLLTPSPALLSKAHGSFQEKEAERLRSF